MTLSVTGFLIAVIVLYFKCVPRCLIYFVYGKSPWKQLNQTSSKWGSLRHLLTTVSTCSITAVISWHTVWGHARLEFEPCLLSFCFRWQAHVAPGRHRGLDRNVSGSQRRCLGSHSEHRRHQGCHRCGWLHSVSGLSCVVLHVCLEARCLIIHSSMIHLSLHTYKDTSVWTVSVRKTFTQWDQ